jgi:competence protein ComGF
MYFTRVTMKKVKGVTILELIAALSISSLIITVIISSYSILMKSYKEREYYASEITGIYEALMYMENYVNYRGEGCFLKDGDIIIPTSVGESYISLDGNELRFFFKNKLGLGHTNQPLLYGVKEFKVRQNGKVLFIKIVTDKGVSGERAIGKI